MPILVGIYEENELEVILKDKENQSKINEWKGNTTALIEELYMLVHTKYLEERMQKAKDLKNDCKPDHPIFHKY